MRGERPVATLLGVVNPHGGERERRRGEAQYFYEVSPALRCVFTRRFHVADRPCGAV